MIILKGVRLCPSPAKTQKQKETKLHTFILDKEKQKKTGSPLPDRPEKLRTRQNFPMAPKLKNSIVPAPRGGGKKKRKDVAFYTSRGRRQVIGGAVSSCWGGKHRKRPTPHKDSEMGLKTPNLRSDDRVILRDTKALGTWGWSGPYLLEDQKRWGGRGGGGSGTPVVSGGRSFGFTCLKVERSDGCPLQVGRG